jgi:hypothetical protein
MMSQVCAETHHLLQSFDPLSRKTSGEVTSQQDLDLPSWQGSCKGPIGSLVYHPKQVQHIHLQFLLCMVCLLWHITCQEMQSGSAICDFHIQTRTLTHPPTRLFMLGACTGGRLGFSAIIQQLAPAASDNLSQDVVSGASCPDTRHEPREQAYTDWLPETHYNQHS